MRACPHCQHQNPDHLGYCARCGKRIGPRTGQTPAPLLAGNTPQPIVLPPGPAATPFATPPPALAQPFAPATTPQPIVTGPPPAPAPPVAAPPVPATDLGKEPDGGADLDWVPPPAGLGGLLDLVKGAVPYVFEYLRGRMDAKARLARLAAERVGDEKLLAGALWELGAAVRVSGLRTPALNDALAAIAAADVRRAAADLAASQLGEQRRREDARLGAEEAMRDSEWQAADGVAREAEDAVRGTAAERSGLTSALARVLDTRARLEAEATARLAAASAGADPAAQAEARAVADGLRRQVEALGPEQKSLEERAALLERKLDGMRTQAESLRVAAQDVRVRLDAATAARRRAAGDAEAIAASHARDSTDAEREIQGLTDELGRLAAKTRPFAAGLDAPYQRVDRLQQAIADHRRQARSIAAALGNYDRPRLYTGIGILGAGAVILVLLLSAIF